MEYLFCQYKVSKTPTAQFVFWFIPHELLKTATVQSYLRSLSFGFIFMNFWGTWGMRRCRAFVVNWDTLCSYTKTWEIVLICWNVHIFFSFVYVWYILEGQQSLKAEEKKVDHSLFKIKKVRTVFLYYIYSFLLPLTSSKMNKTLSMLVTLYDLDHSPVESIFILILHSYSVQHNNKQYYTIIAKTANKHDLILVPLILYFQPWDPQVI